MKENIPRCPARGDRDGMLLFQQYDEYTSDPLFVRSELWWQAKRYSSSINEIRERNDLYKRAVYRHLPQEIVSAHFEVLASVTSYEVAEYLEMFITCYGDFVHIYDLQIAYGSYKGHTPWIYTDWDKMHETVRRWNELREFMMSLAPEIEAPPPVEVPEWFPRLLCEYTPQPFRGKTVLELLAEESEKA